MVQHLLRWNETSSLHRMQGREKKAVVPKASTNTIKSARKKKQPRKIEGAQSNKRVAPVCPFGLRWRNVQ